MKWFCHSSLDLDGYDKYNIFETVDDDEDSVSWPCSWLFAGPSGGARSPGGIL